MRKRLGDGYVIAVRSAYPAVPANVDLVMYWWEKAAIATRDEGARRFGLVSTNSIKQITNRVVVSLHKAAKPPLFIAFAIPDHPWRDEETNAAVRVAMTVGNLETNFGMLRTVASERRLPDGNAQIEFSGFRGAINANLSVGSDTSVAANLKSNRRLSFMGVIPVGIGFRVNPIEQPVLFSELNGTSFIRQYLGGSDLTDNIRPSHIIDIGALDEAKLRGDYPATYQFLYDEVRPHRLGAERDNHCQFWWRFGESRVGMRVALAALSRFIATTETAKFRVFSFLDAQILPDQNCGS